MLEGLTDICTALKVLCKVSTAITDPRLQGFCCSHPRVAGMAEDPAQASTSAKLESKGHKRHPQMLLILPW